MSHESNARDVAESKKEGMDRRGFLGSLGALTAGGALASTLPGCTGGGARAATGLTSLEARALAAQAARNEAAQVAFDRGVTSQVGNGDEDSLPNFIGSFSKGLQHLANGEVDPAQYQIYREALENRDFDLLDSAVTVGPRKLESPQAGLAFPIQGPDAGSAVTMIPAPPFASAWKAGEMVELYWAALARDIHFSDYATHPTIAAATTELSGLSDFRGPKISGQVTPQTFMRGHAPRCLIGPYVSQFLLQDFVMGAMNISQRQRTLQSGLDYLSNFNDWLAIQNGGFPVAQSFDPTARYIRNGRDLAAWVQRDTPVQAALHAAVILLGMGAPLKPGSNPYFGSPTQEGFATFGPPHIICLIAEAAICAIRAVWFQKWYVHRHLRPEEFGGRVFAHLNSMATYPLHPELLNSAALSWTLSATGSSLLPQAFPDGSPRHPAYGSGHATFAAAGVTAVKSFFDENWVIPNPVVASADGLSLVPYAGGDAGQITVGGELDKLAANIAQGRNFAGIHWRCDHEEGANLGEAVTEGIIGEQKLLLNEDPTFVFQRIDGSIAVL